MCICWLNKAKSEKCKEWVASRYFQVPARILRPTKCPSETKPQDVTTCCMPTATLLVRFKHDYKQGNWMNLQKNHVPESLGPEAIIQPLMLSALYTPWRCGGTAPATDKDQWSVSRPGRFTSGKELRYLLNKRLGRLLSPSTFWEEIKLYPLQRFEPKIFRPISCRWRTHYWLGYIYYTCVRVCVYTHDNASKEKDAKKV
jgi:hypothetical protein